MTISFAQKTGRFYLNRMVSLSELDAFTYLERFSLLKLDDFSPKVGRREKGEKKMQGRLRADLAGADMSMMFDDMLI